MCLSHVPPHAYFAVSAVFHYLGPALAVLLLARVEIERLALTTVAAIEFPTVVGLAAWGVRTVRNGVALGLAAGGVYLLTGARLRARRSRSGRRFANAALFALYIVLGHRVSRLARATYALLVALLPATATVVGVVAAVRVRRPTPPSPRCGPRSR